MRRSILGKGAHVNNVPCPIKMIEVRGWSTKPYSPVSSESRWANAGELANEKTMRSRFMLIPAALVAAAPAQAKIFVDIPQAQQLMFPGATFEEHFVTLNQQQFNAIIEDSDVNVYSRTIRAWRVSNGGWFIIDQVRGRDDWISYAVGIDAGGVVRQVEIIECLENYDGITIPQWRAHRDNVASRRVPHMLTCHAE